MLGFLSCVRRCKEVLHRITKTLKSMCSMPRLWSPVPNRIAFSVLHLIIIHILLLARKQIQFSVVESRYNFPKVKQFAIRMFISKGQRCCMTAELFMVNSQLPRTRPCIFMLILLSFGHPLTVL